MDAQPGWLTSVYVIHPVRRNEDGSSEGPQSALLANDPLLASIVARMGSGRLQKAGGTSSSRKATAAAAAAARGQTLKVDVSAWLIPFEHMTLKKQIGGGSFGRVSAGVCRRVALSWRARLALSWHASCPACCSRFVPYFQ